jgi:hypothetical protein
LQQFLHVGVGAVTDGPVGHQGEAGVPAVLFQEILVVQLFLFSFSIILCN